MPAAFAQQSDRVWRIGYLGATSAAGAKDRLDALRTGLRSLGYVEGRNLAFEFRWAEGRYERLAGLAAELVRLKVDVILGQGGPGTRAAKDATTTIPIVMMTAGDALASGLVANLARPEGNITGTTYFASELAAKRLQFLKEAVPRITQVALLVKPGNPSIGPQIEAVKAAATALKMEVRQFAASQPTDFAETIMNMVRQRVDAVEILEDALFNANIKSLANLVAKTKLPSVGLREYAETGGLLGYGVNINDLYRRTSVILDKIFRGIKPSEIPVERPTEFELVINVKSANALGITIPPSLLLRANRVIE